MPTNENDKAIKLSTAVKMFETFYENMPTAPAGEKAVIQFDATDGMFGGESRFATVSTIVGNKLVKPRTDPERTGYTFAGWFTGATDGDNVADLTVESATAVTYYAHWTANSYTVTLNSNDGNNTTSSFDISYGSSGDALTPPTRTGYDFIGYYDGTDATQSVKYYDAAGQNVKAWDKAENASLYACWSVKTCTVTFDKNFTGSSTSSRTISFGESVSVAVPTRTKHNFLGYFDTIDGGEKYFDSDGNSVRAWDKTSDTTLYAHWEEITVRPVYNATTGRYTNESITNWLNSYADGLIYGVQIPLFSYSTAMTGVKTGANAGLVLEPSTNTVAGRNDYLNKKLFFCPRVNGGVDTDGMPYVTAIEGMDDRFSCTEKDTWALTPVYYCKYTQSETHMQKDFCDTATEGFEPCVGAYTASGTLRPYILRACYMESGVKFDSKSGKMPCSGNFHFSGYELMPVSNALNRCVARTSDGLTYLCAADVTYKYEFMQLMLGTKAPTYNLGGYRHKNLFYPITKDTTDCTYVYISKTNTFAVGDFVFIDNGSALSGGINPTTSIVQSARITKKELDGDNHKIYLDVVQPISVTTSFNIGASVVKNGFCDNVLGTFGKETNVLNSYSPYKFQNCEYGNGLSENVVNLVRKTWSLYTALNINRGVSASSSTIAGFTQIGGYYPCPGGLGRYIADTVTVDGVMCATNLEAGSSQGCGINIPTYDGDTNYKCTSVGTNIMSTSMYGNDCWNNNQGMHNGYYFHGYRISSIGHSSIPEGA